MISNAVPGLLKLYTFFIVSCFEWGTIYHVIGFIS